MALAQEETFGPVVPLFRFRRDKEAVPLANATPFGLAAYVYSRDIGRVWRMVEAIKPGWSESIPASSPPPSPIRRHQGVRHWTGGIAPRHLV